MSASDAASPEDVAATLNAICSAAVGAGRSGDAEAIRIFSTRLDERAERFRAGRHAEVADFLMALTGLLRGKPLGSALDGLVEPYRQALRAVAADIAAPRVEITAPEPDPPGRPSAQAPDSPETASADDWVAALTAHVAALLKARDRETAVALAAELEKSAAQPGIDPDAAAYLQILLGVLRGQDLRAQALRLVEPYRSAYGSLQAIMRGADPRAGLLERLSHNAELVMRSKNPDAQEGLTKVLEVLRLRAQSQDEPELARFVGLVGALLDGQLDASSAASADFDDPALARSWQGLVRAWRSIGG